MSTTSKKYFDKKFKKIIWDKFFREIKNIKTEDNLIELLDKFFTDNEKIMLEKRLATLYLLEIGESYKKIGEKIDITPKTISFIKRGFKKKERVARKYSPLKSAPKKNRYPKYPTYIGRGRWGFLNN